MAIKITVNVVANSAKPDVIKLGENEFKVKVDKVPEKGKANKRLIEILAEYFHISKKNIEILHGQTSNKKLIQMDKG